jgi:magnesium-protoporphyrin IX monomethyl ester (oxidative) cyclase
VLPTTLPLPVFYAELVKTQAVINRKHLGVAGLAQTTGIAARLLLRGQTNFVRMLWRFGSVYNGDRQLADHQRPVHYELPPPGPRSIAPGRRELFVHESRARDSRPKATIPAPRDAS